MAARIIYDGLVLTSIDVKPVEGTERTVRFSGSIAGRADDDTATFIEKVRQINDSDEDGKRLFEAETVTVARAKEIINGDLEGGDGKPLFCVHGFNTQPGQHLKEMNDAAKKFNKGKFTLVPVIWPNKRGLENYYSGRPTASGAGKAFKTLKRGIDSFPRKSLLCHSMGNHVLRHAADGKFKFDNIFMVAAVS
jgi:esterase/lipase superfamily enzyme